MTTVTGTIDQPIDDARVATRRAAGEDGWSLSEDQSAGDVLVFKKSSSAYSWGAQLSVQLEAASESQTRLIVSTDQKWALAEWGRGRRAAKRLLMDAGARVDD